jgi:hypothetical protein
MVCERRPTTLARGTQRRFGCAETFLGVTDRRKVRRHQSSPRFPYGRQDLAIAAAHAAPNIESTIFRLSLPGSASSLLAAKRVESCSIRTCLR